MVKTNTKKYTYAVGRRRSAVATIKLFSGKGESTVNGTEVSKYFSGNLNKIVYSKPFTVTETDGKYYFQAKITGGGTNGQLDALALSIARALKKVDEAAYLPALRAENLLSVDSRVRERRKVGTGGKARRTKQSPKR
jgi:small subunit ribosomal protein S9